MKSIFLRLTRVCLFLSTITICALCYAQPLNWDSLRTERMKKITSIRAIYPSVQIKTERMTGVPQELWGDELFLNQSKTDLVEATYEFFDLNKEIFGISQAKTDLKVVSSDKISEKTFGGYGVILRQVYKGVGIWGSWLKVNFNRSGKLHSIVGGTYPDINISVTPAVDSSAAVRIAELDLKKMPGEKKRSLKNHQPQESTISILKSDLLVALFEDEYRLVWIVHLSRSNSFKVFWEYLVDAQSGNVLEKKRKYLGID